MTTHFLNIFLASVAQFVIGAIWYSALFGKLWGRIHGFDKLSKQVQEAMMKEMGPAYLLQFAVTVLMTFILALCVSVMPAEWNAFSLAGLLWLGFVLPTLTSSVLFGGTPSKWIFKKIAVQAGASLLNLEVAAAILHFMQV